MNELFLNFFFGWVTFAENVYSGEAFFGAIYFFVFGKFSGKNRLKYMYFLLFIILQ